MLLRNLYNFKSKPKMVYNLKCFFRLLYKFKNFQERFINLKVFQEKIYHFETFVNWKAFQANFVKLNVKVFKD